MRNFLLIIVLIVSAIVINSCITPFEPAGVKNIDNMVVIEGDIIQNDTTKVIVSRSLAITDLNKINYITKATVWVESEKGTVYSGKEELKSGKTQYLVNTKDIDISLKYKICVKLLSGQRYESDLLPILVSPPIDSIGFTRNYDGESVTFYVNTHDDQNKTKYYKWSYREDWEIQTQFLSLFVYDPVKMKVSEITFDKNRYYCWNYAYSSAVLITTTTHLSKDMVYQKALVTMGPGDRRISSLYSMELRQMAISNEAYLYWENIRKNADEIGGIFSPQPSEIGGNIRCTNNPNERVLGYICAGAISKKRIFASSDDIRVYKDIMNCEDVFVDAANPIPFETLYSTGYDIVNYSNDLGEESFWSLKHCVDCRLYGTKFKPSFWPNNHI